MVAYLDVSFAGRPMGVMSWDSRVAQGWFEFHTDFLPCKRCVLPLAEVGQTSINNAKPLPLDGRWPLFKPAFLTDNLPGPYAIYLLRHALLASGKHPETFHPLAWCALQGRRGLGLIGFEPAGYPELDVVESVDISRLVRHLRSLEGGHLSASRMRELLRSGLFTTTNRPAALLAINDFTGAVLSGHVGMPTGYQGWICWLDGVNQLPVSNPTLPSLDACLLANRRALACGLEVLDCRPLKDGHLTHLLTRRPDRQDGLSYHLLSFPTLLTDTGGVPTDDCAAVFRCLRQLRLSHAEHAAFFRRIVFNGLLYNRLENQAAVCFRCTPEGTWHVSPHTGFPPPLHGGMCLNGRYSNWSLDDYRELGASQGIKRHERIITDVQSAVAALT